MRLLKSLEGEMFDPISYCVSSAYRKHRWAAQHLWFFRTEVGWIYQRRKWHKERNATQRAFAKIIEEGEQHLKGLLDDIGGACEGMQREMDALSTPAHKLYFQMTDTHNKVRARAEKKFSKSFDLVDYFKFERESKALYERILQPIYNPEMREAVDAIFEAIEVYSKVVVIKNKYAKVMPHHDQWLLGSITGFTPNGALGDKILDGMVELNGLVFEEIKNWS